MRNIEIQETADGAILSFDYDRELVAAVKTAFPKARWSAASRAWTLPGKAAVKRAEAWKAERLAATAAAVQVENAARAAVAADAIVSSRVARSASGWIVTVPYDEESVAELRAITGAQWSKTDKSWSVPVRATDALAAIVPALERRADAADIRKAAYDAERAAEREVRRIADAAERQARQDELNSRRMLVETRTLSVGDIIRRGDAAAVVTDLGKAFRIDDEDTSIYGMQPGRHYWMQYAYVRSANAAETETLVARETAEAIEEARIAVARAASHRVEQIAREIYRDGDQPQVGRVEGEDLLPKRLGYRFQGLRLANDGSLWLLQDNSADGDTWAHSNAGGSKGWRLTGDRVSALVNEICDLAVRGGDLG